MKSALEMLIRRHNLGANDVKTGIVIKRQLLNNIIFMMLKRCQLIGLRIGPSDGLMINIFII